MLKPINIDELGIPLVDMREAGASDACNRCQAYRPDPTPPITERAWPLYSETCRPA